MLKIPFITKNKDIDRNFRTVQEWSVLIEKRLRDLES